MSAAAGLPVITTKANGFSEIMEEGVHGSTVENATDTDALVTGLKFWSERDRREAARPRILEWASRYDMAANITATVRVLTQLAASAASTSGKIRKT